MSNFTEKAPAKLNLTLDISSKRGDGYHTIASIMQSVSLCDSVSVVQNKSGKITIKTNLPYLPTDSSNLCYKAAALYFEKMNIKGAGIEINLHKIIPVASGMAGGSSNAAAVLRILQKMYGEADDILGLAAKIGADVPFCMSGGTVLCEGIGDKMTLLERHPSDVWTVVAKNSRKVSTAHVYACYDEKQNMVKNRPNNEAMAQALKDGNIKRIAGELCNVFEPVLYQPPVERLKKRILSLGALGVAMTGAGSAVFGIFEDKNSADKCMMKLREDNIFACSAKFI